MKHSDLPGMEALGREGKKDGQVIMIKNNNQVEAYSVSVVCHFWNALTAKVDRVDQNVAANWAGCRCDRTRP